MNSDNKETSPIEPPYKAMDMKIEKYFLEKMKESIGAKLFASLSLEIVDLELGDAAIPVLTVKKEGSSEDGLHQVEKIMLKNPDNGYSGETTLRAASLAVTMNTYSHLSFSGEELLGEHYLALHGWAYKEEHSLLSSEESSAIYWFLD